MIFPIDITNTRRDFMKSVLISAGLFVFKTNVSAAMPIRKTTTNAQCDLYRAINGTPQMNLTKIIELMGGIENIFGPDDVVLIKPNLQWWNQGAPNLSALKTFIEIIFDRPGGFKGEVVIAENVHRGLQPWQSKNSGWARTFEWNSDIPGIQNMNDLVSNLKRKYKDNFSVCHWIDVQDGNKRVIHPADGPGYVYCDGTNSVPLISLNNGAKNPDYRETIATYPICRTDKGTMIDFKSGIWEKGAYTDQPFKYVNFSALNHHSRYCGMTSAIKNYLGVSDLSGGPDPFDDGHLTDKYYNFHSFPFNKWAPGPKPGMIGAEIGMFLSKIRAADLNITTADWVGLASRTDPPMAHTRAVLACKDPVALDYHAAKYILYPNSNLSIHNPDADNSPARAYLQSCSEHGGGIFDEKCVAVKSFNFNKNAMERDDELVVLGNKRWGWNFKIIMKYFLLKYNIA